MLHDENSRMSVYTLRIEQVLTIPEQVKLEIQTTHNFIDAVKNLIIEEKKNTAREYSIHYEKIIQSTMKKLHLEDYNY